MAHTEEIKKYKYNMRLGSAKTVDAFFPGQRSFFYTHTKSYQLPEAVLLFPAGGDFYNSNKIGDGTNSISSFSTAEYPEGVTVKWYSLFEDQTWEVLFEFDPEFMQTIKNYVIKHPFKTPTSKYARDKEFLESFHFVMQAGPEGHAAIWIESVEKYLLAESVATKSDNDYEYIRSGSYLLERYNKKEDLLKRRLSFMPEEFQKRYSNGDDLSVYTQDWIRRMKRYTWKLTGDDNFKILRYYAFFSNGERFSVWNDKNDFRSNYAVPNTIIMVIQNNHDLEQIEKIQVRFNEDEMLSAFEKLTEESPKKMLNLEVIITPDLKNILVYLTDGKEKLEIKTVNASLEDFNL